MTSVASSVRTFRSYLHSKWLGSLTYELQVPGQPADPKEAPAQSPQILMVDRLVNIKIGRIGTCVVSMTIEWSWKNLPVEHVEEDQNAAGDPQEDGAGDILSISEGTFSRGKCPLKPFSRLVPSAEIRTYRL